ncbi:MAG TPA: hypothetical protein VNT33_04740, partial [Telluria sp.]|nr:hypothetical protein [Telluria sp.]
MKVSKQETSGSQPGAAARLFEVEGRIRREQQDCMPGDLKLMAYVFDKAGHLLGSDALDAEGNYRVRLRLNRPIDVTLFIGPAGIPDTIRQSGAFMHDIADTDWKLDKERYVARFDALLPIDIWIPWFPRRVCVSGHIRKIIERDNVTDTCPVPLVKVEIFDVDREACLWPWFRRWWEYLLDRPVIRLPDLLREPPVPFPPFPGPDPVPDLKLELARPRLATTTFQPTLAAGAAHQLAAPQLAGLQLSALRLPDVDRVAEARLLDPALATRFGQLTVTSRIAPWLIFPNCFYSRELVCETTTDCDGFFNCCFDWWPFHVRHGRLRFDTRPDIIVRVTQVINGVSTVIYMDPYTSTRWNQSSTHIDLYLDDPDVECGATCDPQPPGTTVFFTRVGNDYVYNIDQATGTFHGDGFSNVAYGATLNIQALFGDALTRSGDQYYYRLSVGPGSGTAAGPFKPLMAPVADTRVHKTTLVSESYALGPQVVNGQAALYEVRNMDDYYWYWPDLIGQWATRDDVPDEG